MATTFSTRKALMTLLRNNNFTLDYEALEVLQYIKRIEIPQGVVLVKVQLWDTGKHVIVHRINGVSQRPVNFETGEQLVALLFECLSKAMKGPTK